MLHSLLVQKLLSPDILSWMLVVGLHTMDLVGVVDCCYSYQILL